MKDTWKVALTVGGMDGLTAVQTVGGMVETLVGEMDQSWAVEKVAEKVWKLAAQSVVQKAEMTVG